MKLFETVSSIIKTLHYRHGKGDILKINKFADGHVEVIAKCYATKPHTRRGNIEYKSDSAPFGKVTVRLYGRQITACIIGE